MLEITNKKHKLKLSCLSLIFNIVDLLKGMYFKVPQVCKRYVFWENVGMYWVCIFRYWVCLNEWVP